MTTTVIINGQKIALDPQASVGQGGEADVYNLGNGFVAKIFKDAKHPDFKGDPDQQKAAEARLVEHQSKLPAFPRGLPPEVVAPVDLVHNAKGKVVGYTMPFQSGCEVLLRFRDKSYRTKNQIGNGTVVDLFRSLHGTVAGLHAAQVVIGDFNDLNVLVHLNPNRIHLIDADSMQFGAFKSRVFTAQFVDPLVCRADALIQDKPHSDQTDWYAFAIMLMQSLLYCGPYGGIHKPADKARLVTDKRRPLHRLTVFDPEVMYPKPAIHFGSLPDDLLHHFEQVFGKSDLREPFPLKLLHMDWIECKDCGTPHARAVCPKCGQKGLGIVTQKVEIRGKVTATRMFVTTGTILMAAVQNNHLRWLAFEGDASGGKFVRDGGRTVTQGTLDRFFRYRLQGDHTLIGRKDQLVTFRGDGTQQVQGIQPFGHVAMFDANADRRYWIENGYLMREGQNKIAGYNEQVGAVMPHQTLFWVGETFGFGFYRAGELCRAFLFGTTSVGLLDAPEFPRIQGTLVDATTVFGKDRVFVLTKTAEGSRTVNRCHAIARTGKLEATAEADDGQAGWLGSIRGKCAIGNNLLSATDAGIVRIEVTNGLLAETGGYPDTEPFVDAASHLHPHIGPGGGIYVVKTNEIVKLEIR